MHAGKSAPTNYIATLERQVDGMIRAFVQALPSLAIALGVLIVTWIAARFTVRIADWLTRRTPMRENLKQLVETLVRLAIWLFGLMVALTIAMPGMTPANLFAGLGIGALAIGFAFQDIFQNFLAGVLIMIREKMRIGDFIECEGIFGRVERITLRETYVRGLSNELTIVPNSVLFKNPVRIETDAPLRRCELVVNVPQDSDPDRAAAAIRSAVENVNDVVVSRGVDVLAQEIKAGSIDFLVCWWTGSRPHDLRRTKDEIIRNIRQALAQMQATAAA